MDTLASKVGRKLDSGPRRPRVADRLLKRQNSKYSYRDKGQLLKPTRRAPTKAITLPVRPCGATVVVGGHDVRRQHFGHFRAIAP